jgi:16S rRNA (cytidine1402-2'-O)-methyltransferase
MVYLIPTILAENATETIPAYVLDAIKNCKVFFVENERTARRFFKSIWKEMVIDDYTWYAIHKAENKVLQQFATHIKNNENIGIVSEAGCPGIADPGQILVAKAQEMNALVKPLVGPSSILMALMASGMNGQKFCFNGYLPIDAAERKKTIMQLEEDAIKKGMSQVFIETPFRNDSILKEILQTCKPTTRICVAADISSEKEMIKTKTVLDWKKQIPALHKIPTVFIIGS